jgi:hypothetical protein
MQNLNKQTEVYGAFWASYLALVIVVSIFQIYVIKIGGVSVALFYLLAFGLIPLALKSATILSFKPVFFFLIFISTQLFSLIWSVDLNMGLKHISREFTFVVIVLATYSVSFFYKKSFNAVFSVFFLLLLVPGLLIVWFQLSPVAEMEFLKSSLAKVVINPNLLESFFSDSPNNVFDVNKAGGFFINGNVAAAYFGIAGFVALGLWLAYKTWLYLLFSFVFFIVAVFTGSKASIVFISLFFLFFLLILDSKYKYILYLFLGILSFALMLLLASLLYTFKGELIETVSVRLLIWSHFFNIFIPNFYSGLGFGGWLPSFMANADSYGITAAFPPHNVFIATWAESGVSALMVLVIFYYYLISFSFKLLRSEGRELRGLGVAVLFSSLWILLHGMGENFGPIGEDHMFVLHAVVLGYSYARYKKRC